MIEIGMIVNYVPHKDYCYERQQDGKYPWTFGPAPGGKLVPGKVYEDGSAAKTIQTIMKQKRAVQDSMLPVEPQVVWKGTVTAVHEGGLVDLDVKTNQPGITHHIARVKYEPRGLHAGADAGHTWHFAE